MKKSGFNSLPPNFEQKSTEHTNRTQCVKSGENKSNNEEKEDRAR